jgi:hypothetical protein
LSFTGDAVLIDVGPAVANVQGLDVNAASGLIADVAVPAVFPSGIPCPAGSGSVSTVAAAAAVAPLSFQNGFAFDANSRLVTVTNGLAASPRSAQNGFNFDATGALIATP